METGNYALLLKIAETGNLTKAARQMGYTQSAASHIIKKLESAFDMKLVASGRFGTSLTKEGIILLPYLRDIVAGENKLKETMDSIKGVQAGTLRIGAFSSVCLTLLPQIIGEFSDRYPGIKIEIMQNNGHYQELVRFLEGGMVDCSFVCLPVPGELHCITLAKDRFMAVLPQGHPLSACPEVSFEQLQQIPFLMPDRNNDDDILFFMQKFQFMPKVAMTLHDDLALLRMAENGLGGTILTEMVTSAIPHRAVIRPVQGCPARTICLATRTDVSASPLLDAFISVVTKHFNQWQFRSLG